MNVFFKISGSAIEVGLESFRAWIIGIKLAFSGRILQITTRSCVLPHIGQKTFPWSPSHRVVILVRWSYFSGKVSRQMGAIGVHRFTSYCQNKVISQVKYLTGYSTKDWALFQKTLKRFYFQKDTTEAI